jgi:N-acetylglucosamine kinase-like BadF-type ATPase
MRIGIDVGGTNTDAVLMDGQRVLAWVKSPTTSDVTAGLVKALSALLARTTIAPGDLTAVTVGTTHFTNAVVERKALSRTAVVRNPRGRPSDWDGRDSVGGDLVRLFTGQSRSRKSGRRDHPDRNTRGPNQPVA